MLFVLWVCSRHRQWYLTQLKWHRRLQTDSCQDSRHAFPIPVFLTRSWCWRISYSLCNISFSYDTRASKHCSSPGFFFSPLHWLQGPVRLVSPAVASEWLPALGDTPEQTWKATTVSCLKLTWQLITSVLAVWPLWLYVLPASWL